MDIFEAIEKRHSYRGAFQDKAVPKEDLQQIVQAGIQAPSGKNAQTTQFVIIDDADILRQIQEMHPRNYAMQQARAYIVCIVDRDPEKIYEGYAFVVEDCAAAVENMLLAVTALGYATVWIDGWLRLEQRAERISQLIQLPEDKIVRVLLPLGVPVEQRSQKEKLPFDQRAWLNRYGG
jgi:nitroreductase